MKTISAILVISCGILESFGQGTVNFGNNSSTAITNPFTMMRVVAGTTFRVGLYYAPDGSIPDDRSMFQIGASGIIGPAAGLYAAGTRTTPNSTPGAGFAVFQVRLWETAFGTSYEAVLNNNVPQGGRLGVVGKSNCIRVKTGDPVNNIPPASLTAYGLSTLIFSGGLAPFPEILACPVPEPGTWLTVGTGMALLFASRLLRSRRRK